MFRAQLAAILPVQAEYIDGSFVTGKPDPKDIDGSVWINADDMNQLGPSDAAQLVRLRATLPARHLDIYFVAECPDGHPGYLDFQIMLWTDHYWTRCRDSNGAPLPAHQFRKGYVRIDP